MKNLLFLFTFLCGCIASNPKFFAGVQPTEDKNYGYSINHPITLKNGNLDNSIGSTYYFLSRLRTAEGNKLIFVSRRSINNPNYTEPAIQLTNRNTGRPMNAGSGPILDVYVLASENEKDTFKIYVNPYVKGPVYVPSGLIFEKDQ